MKTLIPNLFSVEVVLYYQHLCVLVFQRGERKKNGFTVLFISAGRHQNLLLLDLLTAMLMDSY